LISFDSDANSATLTNSGIFQLISGIKRPNSGIAAEFERGPRLKRECTLEFLQAILDKIGRLRGEIAVLEQEHSDSRQDAREHKLSQQAHLHLQALTK
jgi:hypothetical protein